MPYVFDTSHLRNTVLLLIISSFSTRLEAQEPKLVLPIGHSAAIVSAEFSPDGKKIVTGSDDYQAKIWDASSGLLLADLKGHEHKIAMVRFSAAGDKIVTASFDKTARVWNAQTGAFLFALEGHQKPVYSAQFNVSGDKIITSSEDGTTRTWSAVDGEMISELPASGERHQVLSPDGKKFVFRESDTAWLYDLESANKIRLQGADPSLFSVHFSRSGEMIAAGGFDSRITIWNALTGDQVHQFTAGSWVQTVRFSSDGSKIMAASQDRKVNIWDLKTKKLLQTLSPEGGILLSANYSADGSKILTASRAGSMSIWDAMSGKLIHKLEGHSPYVYLIFGEFSPDGKKVISGSEDKTTRIWDVETGRELIRMEGHARVMQTIQFDEKGTLAEIKNWDDNTPEFWDLTTGVRLQNDENEPLYYYSYYSQKYEEKHLEIDWDRVNVMNVSRDSILATLQGHTNLVFSAAFSVDGRKILTTSNDHTNRLWTSAGEPLLTFFGVDSLGYFSQIPEGYYQTDAKTAKLLHYVTPDLKFITFEQLDTRYNRPDKVLERLGNPDTALIRSYRQAWEKRIRKLGLDTSTFREDLRVPEADISNRNEITFEQNNLSLPLRLYAIDSSYALDRLNVWINEVPLYGKRGISLRNKDAKTFDSTVNVTLSEGLNRIEFSVTNTNGLESYRMPLIVNNKKEIKKPTLHFVGIGIDRFIQSEHNLTYSVKDIRDLAKALKARYGNAITIDTLFDERVSRKNVAALKNRLQQSSVDDKVILAYSGHGLLDSDFDYFLSTYSIDFENPHLEGIPYEELENLLDSIPSRKKLMLIDACHSGEVDKDDVERLGITTANGVKGLRPVAYKKDGQLGLKNSFELMRTLFVNVGKSTGAVIISAAGGTEFALEGGKVPNGVFTHSILETLRSSSSIRISELQKTVSAMVTDLTDGLQKPTSRNETISVDWEL